MKVTMNKPRRQLPPMAPHKRKFRDETFDFLKPSKTAMKPPPSKITKPSPHRAVAPIKTSKAASSQPAHDNLLLAGYLAHEYLSKGTLFGQLYNSAQDKSSPAYATTSTLAGFKTMNGPLDGLFSKKKGKDIEPKPKSSELVKNEKYAQVSELLKHGVPFPGIVNPSQLASFLHL